MATPVTPLEIIRYRELRQMGYSVRQAAAKVGRPRTTLHRYDPFYEPKGKAPKLEEAILEPIEEAIQDALPEDPMDRQFTPQQIVDLHPMLRDRVRGLANLVNKLIDRLRGR